MILANELRLGNCVNIEVSNGDETVKFTNGIITEISKRVRVNEIVFDYKNLMPVPLTEEWIFKAGFDKFTGNPRLRCNRFILEFSDNVIWIDGVNLNIKYVHQLQNVYFALTGQELEFKEIELL